MSGNRQFDQDLKVLPDGLLPSPKRVVTPGPAVGLIALVVVAVVVALLAAPSGPRVNWESAEAPTGVLNTESLIATPEGFSVLAGPQRSGGAIWSTPDGERWTSRPLPRVSARIVYHHAGLFVVDGRELARLGPDADDAPVKVDLPGVVRLGNGSQRSGLIAARGGMLAQTVSGDLFWSPNGRQFTLSVAKTEWRAESDVTLSPEVVPEVARQRVRSACSPAARRAPDIPPIIETSEQVVAFIPEADPSVVWPICEPILWTSSDGLSWAAQSETSPFPDGSYVYDVAWRDGRYVAVGGFGFDETRVWSSQDGVTWEQLEFVATEQVVDLTDVAAGGLGWIVMAVPRDGSERIGWYSPDGSCWEALPDGVTGRSVAIGDDHILLIAENPTVWVGTRSNAFSLLGRCA